MINELVTTHTKLVIEQLLNVMTLAAMAKASLDSNHSNDYLYTAACWMPNIKGLIADIDKELSVAVKP